MLNCPFCGYDYTEDGPREGRCPGCGGVLAWNGAVVDQEESDDTERDAAPGESYPAAAHAAQTLPDRNAPEFADAPVDLEARTGPTVPVPPAAAPGSAAPAATPPPTDLPAAEPPRAEASPGSQTDRNHIAQRATLDASPAAAAGPRELSGTDRRHVTAVWAKSLHGIDSPRTTITTDTIGEQTTSNLVIRPRTVRRPQDTTSTPADYELLKVIGEGGVGVVYAARQSSIDRTVAVKMLKPETVTSEEKEKFLFEAMITGDLDHPNIVPIYDLGSNKIGDLFYSMKRVRGTPWCDVMGRKSLPENLEILMKCCDAIAFAHARHVVHRDIKPENVMLGDFGEVLMMDWGISLSTSLTVRGGAAVTSSAMGGTPAYMAPEMATGPLERISAASDVYLLGAVLFEIVTGLTPHTGHNVMDCLLAAARNEIQPVQESGELLDIALRAMATRIGDRYASVQQLQAAIRQYQEHSESIALSTRAEEDLQRAVQSNNPEDFARAVFGFNEAHVLWRGNRTAREGLSRAKLAYARSAYQKDDFRLGLSVLDDDDPAHIALKRQLEAGIRERESRQRRLNGLKRLAGLLVLIMAVGAAIAFVVILGAKREADDQRMVAEGLAEDYKNQKAVAVTQRENAKQAKDEAVQREQDAQDAKEIADDERRKAEVAQRKTMRSMQREEASSYLSEIRLIYGQIANNDYGRARRELTDHRDSTKRPLRHWEWGHLWYLCRLDTATLEAAAADAGSLEAVALSHDDRLLAAGSSNGSVFLWTNDGASHKEPGQPLSVIPHGSPVYAVAFSHDGRLLATGGGTDRTGDVKLWELTDQGRSPRLICELAGAGGHRGRVTSLEFSSDDRQLLTASIDHTARLWHAQPSPAGTGDDPVVLWRNRQPLASPGIFRGHFDTVWDAHFSHDPQQRWVVTAGEDGTVRIWDRRRYVQVQRFSQHEGAVFSAAFSPDQRYVVSGGYDRNVLLWEAKIEEQLRAAQEAGKDADELFRSTFVADVKRRLEDPPVDQSTFHQPTFHRLTGHGGSALSVGFSHNGALLLSGGSDNIVKIWDGTAAVPGLHPSGPDFQQRTQLREHAQASPADDESLLTLRGHGSWVTSAVFSSDGRQVFSASRDMTVKRWTLGDYRQLRVFQGPDRAVLSAAISPDEQHLAAAFDDGTATVWDVQGEQPERILAEGHEYLTSRAVFSPDGSRLMTTAADGTVRLWDVLTGTEQQRLDRTGTRGLLALSGNGQWLIAGSMEKDDVDTECEREVPRLWNLAEKTDKLLDHGIPVLEQLEPAYPNANRRQLIERIPDITVACLSADGGLAFTGDEDGGCWLWDTTSTAPPKYWRGHSLSLTGATFTADGASLLTASADHTVARWDSHTGEPKGGRLAHTGAVTLFDVTAEGDAETLVLTAATHPEGTSTDPAGENRSSVYLWQLGQTKPRTVGIPADRISSLAFFPDGRAALIAAVAGRRHRLWLWDFDKDEAEPVWSDSVRPGSISAAIFVPHTDAAQVLTVGGNGARLWDRDSGRRLITFQPHDAVTAVRFSPDSQLVVTASRDGSAKIWTYRDEVRALCKLEGGANADPAARGHAGPVNSAEFHPHPGERQVVTSSDDGTAKLWGPTDNSESWRVRRTFAGPGDDRPPVRSACFSPDGNQILTALDDGTARIWNAHDETQPPAVIPCHNGPALYGTFSPDGRWIATSGRDRTVALFDLATQAELTRLAGFSAAPLSLAFSPDRQRMLTSEAKTIRLWDLQPLLAKAMKPGGPDAPDDDESQPGEDGVREVLALEKHEREITSVSFSHSGRDVLSAALDGQTILWPGTDVEPAVVLALDEVAYAEPQTPVFVDRQALVRTPSAHVLPGSTLTVRLVAPAESPLTEREWLEISDDGVDGIRLDDNRQLLFDRGGDEVPFAQFHGPVSGDVLQVDLNGNASALALERLVRSVTYRNEALPESEQTRTVEFQFTPDGDEPPSARHTVSSRTIRIVPPAAPNQEQAAR